MKKLLYILTFSLVLFNYQKVTAQNCTVNADIDKDICSNETLQLQGAENGLITVHAVWSQVGGPTVNIDDPNNLNTTVSGFTSGNTYTFRITATCEDGRTVYNDVNYTVHPISTADAGADITSCPGTLNLSANSVGAGETAQWSIINNSGGISGLTVSDPSSSITLPPTAAGTSTLRWTITGGSCTSSDEVEITNIGGESPISAGPDQTLSQCYTSTQSVTLNGSFGGNNINGQQGTWTMVSGPNYPNIVNPNNNSTQVTGLIEGTYIFRWEVTGPCVNGSDEVTITVPAATQDVTNVANFPNQTYCYAESDIVLEGTTPQYANEVGYWTQITSYPATIANPSSSTTTVSNLDGISSYRFRYVIENTATGCTSGTDDVRIFFREKPTINVSTADPNLPCGITDADITVNHSTRSSARYKIISGPYTTGWRSAATNTTVDFTDNNTQDPAGTYTLQFESYLTGVGCTSDFDELTITVSESPEAANAGTDQILACNITETDLAGNIPAVGSGVWSVVSKPVGVPDPIIDDITDPKSHISGLEVGRYTFRWLISAGNNCPSTQDDVDVIVSKSTTSSAAGDAKTVCHSTEIRLEGSKLKPNETGVWSVAPATGVSFANINDPSTTVTGLNSANQSYTFTWSVTNGCGTVSDDVVITTSNIQGPTIADAGSDLCENSGTITVGMDGNNPIVGTGTWTVVEGPNSPVIVTPTLNTTDITGLVNGEYKIIWAINVPTCQASIDTLNVTIKTTDNLTADAGLDQSICGNTATMNANAIAPGASGSWVQVSGNAGYTISSADSPNAVFSNLSPGRYEFKWVIEEGICPVAEDNIVFTVSEPPSPALTESDKTICNGNTTTIAANIPISGNGVWSIVSAPNSPSIASVISPTTTVTGLTSGEYTFRWTISSGADCEAQKGIDDLTVQVSAIADAGSDIDLCDANSIILEGTDGTDGTWSLVSGSPIPTISNNNYNTALVKNLGGNTSYQFRYTLPNIYGCSGTYSDDMTLTTSPYGSEPNAGPDQEICTSNGTSITMAADAPGTGNGEWLFVSGPSTPTISDPFSNTSTVSGLNTEGVYIFEWNVDYNNCNTYKDVMRVNVYDPPTTANAGPDQNNACQLTAQLAGNVPTIGIGTWTLISSPAGNTASIEIVNVNSANTRLLNPSHLGTYTFRWTITNGTVCNASIDDVNITFTDYPPITPDADADRNLCNVSSITMSGNDPSGNGIGTWSQVSGPNTVSIINPTNYNTDINGLMPGNYEFEWAITRGGCTLSDNMMVINSALPSTAQAGTDQDLCKFDVPELTANAPASGTGQWSVVSGTTTPVILTPDNTSTKITGTDVGTYTFRWTISNGVCPDETDDVVVNIHDLPSSTLSVGDDEVCDGANANVQILSSENTVTYRLFDGSTLLNTQTGDGNDLDFTVPNTALSVGENFFSYTATNSFNCSVDLINQSMVKVNANPNSTNLVSNDIVCEGSNATVTISNSDNGSSYEVFKGANSLGTANGNGGDLDISFSTDGTWVGANTLTIVATSNSTGCVSNLNNQSTITVNPNPLDTKTVSGNAVCEGSDGLVTIAASETNVNYEAFIGATSVGTGAGTGSDLNINVASADIPTANSYTINIVATSTTSPTNCSVPLTDTGTIIVNSLPTTNQTVSADPVCSGSDASVSLNSTQNGVTYNVYNGIDLIGTGVGNGASINISFSTSSLNTGNNNLTLTATNSSNCSDNLDNSVSLTVYPNPDNTNPVSDDIVCEGSNATVTISNSDNGSSYEAFKGANSLGTANGNGGDLDISFSTDGTWVGANTLTIVATSNSTGCVSNLNNQSTITVNPNPLDTKTVSGNAVCEGSDGLVTIATSETNVNYEAFIGATSVGTGAGTGSDLNINVASADIPTANSYTINIVATSTTSPTNCSVPLTDTGTIIVNSLPTTNQTVSADPVCSGSDANVSLNSTQNGVTYNVYNGIDLIGTGVGNGASINISFSTSSLNTGNNILTLTATNSSNCSDNLDNSVSLTVYANPDNTNPVSDDIVCEGSSANITLSTSENLVNYEAFINTTSVWTGTGNGGDLDITVDKDNLSLGNNEVNIIASNANNCTSNLIDKSIITVNQNPDANLFTEGSTNCSTDDAFVTIEASEESINYELFLDTILLGSVMGNSNDISATINSSLLNIGENIIKIVATNSITNCRSVLVNEPIVIIEQCDIIVYNGFTPNGDGVNDYFTIIGLENIPNHKVTIFNRWGNKVYEASPYLNDWDGTNMFGVSIGDNKLPVGTYYYIIDPGDGGKVLKGFIYLDY